MIGNMKKPINRFIAILFLIIFSFVIINNTFFSNLEYYCKVTTDLSAKAVLLSAVVLITIIALSQALLKKLEIKLNQKKLFLVILLIFFVFQIVLLKNVFFITGWDSNVILTDSYLLRDLKIEQLNHYYYSVYPNNIFLTYIFATIMKLEKFLGIVEYSHTIFGLVVVQSVLCTITAYLLFHIIYHFKKSFMAAWFGFGMYVVLIIFSGWTGIVYSDSMGLIFPTSMIWLYQNRNTMHKFIVWPSIALLGYWGYRIKPQIFIMFYCDRHDFVN